MCTLEQILKMGDYACKIEECGGLIMIENLQYHTLQKIYEKSKSILENYYKVESDNQPIVEMLINTFEL